MPAASAVSSHDGRRGVGDKLHSGRGFALVTGPYFKYDICIETTLAQCIPLARSVCSDWGVGANLSSWFLAGCSSPPGSRRLSNASCC
eukprot:349588-Chlamydomonas_euryale.AAC.6